MFSSPIVIPHADGDISCVQRNQDNYSGEYGLNEDLSSTNVWIRHSNVKASASRSAALRHAVEFNQTVFETETTPELFRKCYVVIEHMPVDLDVKLADALADWLISSVNANIHKLMQRES